MVTNIEQELWAWRRPFIQIFAALLEAYKHVAMLVTVGC